MRNLFNIPTRNISSFCDKSLGDNVRLRLLEEMIQFHKLRCSHGHLNDFRAVLQACADVAKDASETPEMRIHVIFALTSFVNFNASMAEYYRQENPPGLARINSEIRMLMGDPDQFPETLLQIAEDQETPLRVRECALKNLRTVLQALPLVAPYTEPDKCLERFAVLGKSPVFATFQKTYG